MGGLHYQGDFWNAVSILYISFWGTKVCPKNELFTDVSSSYASDFNAKSLCYILNQKEEILKYMYKLPTACKTSQYAMITSIAP